MTATREDFAAHGCYSGWPNSVSPTELLQHNFYL